MTKVFNFSLQKILDVRTSIEDNKAIDLQKARAETVRKKQSLALIHAEKNAIVSSDSADPKPENVSLLELSNRTAYVEQLTEKMEKQGEAVRQSQAETEARRIAFIQASKEKMVIEKLKDKHLETYRRKLNQDQVKNESEVASRISQNGKLK